MSAESPEQKSHAISMKDVLIEWLVRQSEREDVSTLFLELELEVQTNNPELHNLISGIRQVIEEEPDSYLENDAFFYGMLLGIKTIKDIDENFVMALKTLLSVISRRTSRVSNKPRQAFSVALLEVSQTTFHESRKYHKDFPVVFETKLFNDAEVERRKLYRSGYGLMMLANKTRDEKISRGYKESMHAQLQLLEKIEEGSIRVDIHPWDKALMHISDYSSDEPSVD